MQVGCIYTSHPGFIVCHGFASNCLGFMFEKSEGLVFQEIICHRITLSEFGQGITPMYFIQEEEEL